MTFGFGDVTPCAEEGGLRDRAGDPGGGTGLIGRRLGTRLCGRVDEQCRVSWNDGPRVGGVAAAGRKQLVVGRCRDLREVPSRQDVLTLRPKIDDDLAGHPEPPVHPRAPEDLSRNRWPRARDGERSDHVDRERLAGLLEQRILSARVRDGLGEGVGPGLRRGPGDVPAAVDLRPGGRTALSVAGSRRPEERPRAAARSPGSGNRNGR